MKFNEFIEETGNCLSLDEGFVLRKIAAGDRHACLVKLEEMHSIIIVYSGVLTININGRYHLLAGSCFADIVGEPLWEIVELSEDVVGCQLFFTSAFLENLLKKQPPFPISYVLDKKVQPVSALDAPMLQIFMERIESMESILRDNTHYFRSPMLKCALWMFFMDIANAYLSRKGNDDTRTEPERKKMLFMRLINLISEHVRENHTVNFYASQLCITPQYLNRIVKSLSGRTVSDWIDVRLIGEIAQLLEDTDDSVQQIADELNFPDQATLARFFKRQKGISPTEYRRQHKLSV